MIRSAATLLTLSLCLPAYASKHSVVLDMPCATLWPAVVDTIRNFGKYEPLSIDNSYMTAAYKVGSAMSRVTNSVALVPRRIGCELDIDAPYRGLAYHDASDFTDLERLKSASAADQADAPASPTFAATLAQQDSLSQAMQSNVDSGKGSPAQSMQSGSQSRKARDSRSAGSQPASASAGEQPSGPVQLPAGAHIVLTVDARCAKDPDPTGFIGDDFYSKCKPNELNIVRSVIAATLGPEHVLAPGAAGPASFRLAVTLTKSIDKRPSGFLPFSDFASGTMMYEANYQLSDSAGSPSTSARSLIKAPTITRLRLKSSLPPRSPQ